MNSNLRTEPLGVAILALAMATVALSACTDDSPAIGSNTEVVSFIGVKPAPPGAIPDAPTPVDSSTATGNASTVTAQQASKEMPLPGQANDHSTLAANASQKSGTKQPTVVR
jgi:hypothetical protein